MTRSRRLMCGVVFCALVPFALSACSNNKKTPQALIPFSGGERVAGELAIPTPKPNGDLQNSVVFNKPKDGNHASGQSFASVSTKSPASNIISNQTKFSSKTFGVAGSPRVAETIEVRKGGGRYHVGKPYSIRGIRYVPKEDPSYRAVGLASWYGPNFHGRLTANGEVYDQFALSAAHPTMPLPSYAKVTNLENGASIVVRVNDRGPFARGRIIDLSSRAAQLLGYTKKGVAKVKVEFAGKARMDGLDEQQLLASYYPGDVDVASIPPNPGRPVSVATSNPGDVISKGLRKTLDLFSKENGAEQDVSAVQTVRPTASLVNGYDSEQPQSVAVSKINSLISPEEMNVPSTGMQDLATVQFGPFHSKADLFRFSEIAANHGMVTIIPGTEEFAFNIDVLLPSEDIAKLESSISKLR